MIEVGVTNVSGRDRQARVMVFFEGQPDLQYGRDIGAPAHSTIKSWILTGPAPLQNVGASCKVQALLYELIDGKERLVLSKGQESVRSYLLPYKKRDRLAAMMLDESLEEERPLGTLPQVESGTEEAFNLALSLQEASYAKEPVHRLPPGSLPTSVEAFDGMDQFVLASNRLSQDPLGTQALRYWLERGGHLWIMLDKVDSQTIAPLLGEALDFEMLDRTGLTSTKIESAAEGNRNKAAVGLQHERPVDFVRVLLPSDEQPLQVLNGWPAAFTREVGRGKVLFTTVGLRAWTRPRTVGDSASPYKIYPILPMASDQLTTLLRVFVPEKEKQQLVDAFRPILQNEIGYSVISRQTMTGMFLAFFLAAGILIFLFRNTKHLEILGWLGPIAAICAAAAFFFLGESSRRSAPATTAMAQLVQAQPGEQEASVEGLLGIYRPDSGLIALGAQQGGLFQIDLTGIESPKRFMTTDVSSWHWDGLSLPAGVRFAPLKSNISSPERISVKAHFGPQGLEGKIESGPFSDLEDAVLSTKNGRNLAVQLRPDGTFTSGNQDILQPGQFLLGNVLSDRQRLRQDFYRKFSDVRNTRLADDDNALLAWAKPVDLHFETGQGDRSTGTALIIMPLTFEKPVPDQTIAIPAAFIPLRQIVENLSVRPRPELSAKADMHLRFQLPQSVLPFKIERAKFTGKIDAPSRSVTVFGLSDSGAVQLHRVENPIDPVEIEIKDEQLLKLDEKGGLHLNLSLSDLLKKAGDSQTSKGADKWSIDYLELEVYGRALATKDK
ncbi:MAG TPA: hypothetical protein VGZ25_16890 [Gemmataceae bacterium]|nr:hypothetical protein [Gemmataceae bacterium]